LKFKTCYGTGIRHQSNASDVVLRGVGMEHATVNEHTDDVQASFSFVKKAPLRVFARIPRINIDIVIISIERS
jgi:hypothetical protein